MVRSDAVLPEWTELCMLLINQSKYESCDIPSIEHVILVLIQGKGKVVLNNQLVDSWEEHFYLVLLSFWWRRYWEPQNSQAPNETLEFLL